MQEFYSGNGRNNANSKKIQDYAKASKRYVRKTARFDERSSYMNIDVYAKQIDYVTTIFEKCVRKTLSGLNLTQEALDRISDNAVDTLKAERNLIEQVVLVAVKSKKTKNRKK